MPTIIRVGGGAGGVNTIVVTVKSGATVTATKGSKTVSGVSVNGTCTLKVPEVGTWTVTATKDGVEASATVTVEDSYSVKFSLLPPVGTALNDCTWDDISKIAAAGLADTYWDVSATKSIVINGTVGTLSISNLTVNAFILGFDHNSAYEGTNKIHFQIGKIGTTLIGLVDASYNSKNTDGSKIFNMNHWGNYNYGGWAGCDVRYDILGSTDVAPSGYSAAVTTSRVGYDATENCATSPIANTLMAALPADLRAVMKGVTKYAEAVGNSSNVSANVKGFVDYLPLLAEFEVHGARKYANQYEQNYQKQYDYYKNGNSKIMYRHSDTGSKAWWRLRSPNYNNSNKFCSVNTDGSASNNYAWYAGALSPGFVV